MRIVDYETQDRWLAAKPSYFGSADTRVLCGLGYADESTWKTWGQKTGLVPYEADNELYECGRILQPAILTLASRQLDIEIQPANEFEVYYSDERPYVGATLDGIGEDKDGELVIVEAKNVSAFYGRDWQADEPPLRVNVQLQHQFYAANVNRGYAVGLIGGNRVVCRRVERDDRFLAVLLPRIDEVWELVQTNTPPPVDDSEVTADVIKQLYAVSNLETIDLPPHALIWDKELREVKAVLKDYGRREVKLENQFKVAIATAEAGALPGGVLYTWKSQTTNHAAKEAYSSTFRVLRRKEPCDGQN